jgi:hypothetical protein
VENAHNYFLQLAAETGAFGLIGFAWVVAASLHPALTDRGARGGARRLLAIGALGYLATLLTGHALLLSRHAILFWGFLGALSAPYESPPSRSRGRYAGWLAVPLFLAALGLDRAPHDCQREPRASGPLRWEFGLGFHTLEKAPGQKQRWMTDAGEVQICNPTDRPLVADVSFAVQSFDESRGLSVYSRDEPVADVSVGPNPGAFTVRDVALAPGLTPLHFIASPGARRIDDLLHNGDRRSVSILFVGRPRFARSETGEALPSSGLPR